MDIMTEFTNILTGALLPAFYLLYQLPLLLASGLLARRFRPRNWFEFFTVAGFLYTLFMTAVPAMLGSAGLLTAAALLSRHGLPARRCRPSNANGRA